MIEGSHVPEGIGFFRREKNGFHARDGILAPFRKKVKHPSLSQRILNSEIRT
ncbi:hypothetical protein FHS16_003619 [Paenibacillus endophyticus]|uniref:Uncharacterized protein n=1 Tax=Paenibacillus endophyticus TaxID=1294268 RepID=A0A7W5C9G5_9BACL|nr:hypothetical protein [Paenibacillus endophyticus]